MFFEKWVSQEKRTFSRENHAFIKDLLFIKDPLFQTKIYFFNESPVYLGLKTYFFSKDKIALENQDDRCYLVGLNSSECDETEVTTFEIGLCVTVMIPDK